MRKTRIMLAAVVAIGAGVVGYVALRRPAGPAVPDLHSVALDRAVGFVGTDDFNLLGQGDRRAYCLAVAERLRERSFPQLLSMVVARNGDLKRVAENVERAGDEDDVEAAVLRVMLDKFYEEPAAKRSAYLWGLVRLQQSGRAGQEGVGLPSPSQLHEDMTRVLTRQPPQTVAKMGQFIQDLQSQRRLMGVPDPY